MLEQLESVQNIIAERSATIALHRDLRNYRNRGVYDQNRINTSSVAITMLDKKISRKVITGTLTNRRSGKTKTGKICMLFDLKIPTLEGITTIACFATGANMLAIMKMKAKSVISINRAFRPSEQASEMLSIATTDDLKEDYSGLWILRPETPDDLGATIIGLRDQRTPVSITRILQTNLVAIRSADLGRVVVNRAFLIRP